MHSAFKRGVELLIEPESDAAQSQGKAMENSGRFAFEYMKGIGGVPKNAIELKFVIDKLISKMIVITIRLISACQ
jgi:hypothetical protein